MLTHPTNDAEALGLAALAATLVDDRRAMRFLDLTGLDVDDLRARAGERSLLAETLAFLENHEHDLVAVADAIGTTPQALVAARAELEQ